MSVLLSVMPFISAVLLAFASNLLLASLGLAWSWIFGISLAAFFTYGYDKAVAGRGVTRVPEVVLHALTLLGGTLGSGLGMQIFRHKTQKKSFQTIFWAIVIVQSVVIILLVTRR